LVFDLLYSRIGACGIYIINYYVTRQFFVKNNKTKTITMRKLLVGGNWKCNGNVDFSRKFPTDVLKTLVFNQNKVEVVVAPSFIHLGAA